MAIHSQPVSPRDALDIVFANRNRAYGAYVLRREYPVNLGKALGIGLLLIGFFIVLPRVLHAFSSLLPKETQSIEYVVSDINVAPEIVQPSPPPLPTPPPPTRTTIAYVPPVVVEDDKAPDNVQMAIDDIIEKPGDIGKVNATGTDDAPPEIDDSSLNTGVVVTQVKQEDDNTYDLVTVNKMPSFPGGEHDLMKYLAENIEYPAMAREANIEGVVALGFVIGKDGSISDIQVLKDIGGGCGKEASRVVKSMPKWTPGEANGHPVKVRFTLPVRFRLQ